VVGARAGAAVVGGLVVPGLTVVAGVWAGARVVTVVGAAPRVVPVVGAVTAGPDEAVVGAGSGAGADDTLVGEIVEDAVVGERPVAN
jgi:hypothetical protein